MPAGSSCDKANCFTQDTTALIDITVFPEFEETEELVQARPDAALDASIICKSVLGRLEISYEACDERLMTDSYETTHTSIGRLDLRWHESDKAKSFLETFFVVESRNPSVILGAKAISEANQGKEYDTYTLGLEKQTAGINPYSFANVDIVRSLQAGGL